MNPPNILIINPVEVLQRLAPTDASRPPWRGWVTSVHQGKASPGHSAHVLDTLNALCTAIDQVADAAEMQDINLTDALAGDIRALNSSTGELASQLQKPTVVSLRNLIGKSCPTVTIKEVHDLIARCDDVITLLRDVSDKSAALATSAAQTLERIGADLRAAEATGVLFVDPLVFAERGRSLVTYGLTLQREGVTREAGLLLAISVALLGLLPPLALPAAALSVTLALAERATERERLGRRSRKELPPGDD